MPKQYSVAVAINRKGKNLNGWLVEEKKQSTLISAKDFRWATLGKKSLRRFYTNLNTRSMCIMRGQYCFCTNIFRWSRINMRSTFFVIPLFFKIESILIFSDMIIQKLQVKQFKCYITHTEIQICKMMLNISGNAPLKCCSICRGCTSQSKRVLLNSTASGRGKFQALQNMHKPLKKRPSGCIISQFAAALSLSYVYCKQQAMVEMFAIYCLGADAL